MKKLKLNFQPLKNVEELTKIQMQSILGGDDPIPPEKTFKHGKCAAPVTGQWDYTTPVSFSLCQNDIWNYCSNQTGTCYNDLD